MVVFFCFIDRYLLIYYQSGSIIFSVIEVKISSKGQASLTLLIYLGNNYSDEFISLNTISKNTNLSVKYLSKIIIDLVKNNVVLTSRGKLGGYRLSSEPSNIKIGDILRITEKSFSPINCVLNPDSCKDSVKCNRYKMWLGLDNVIRNYLDNTSLKDIL